MAGRGAAGWLADILFRSHVDGITVPWCRVPVCRFDDPILQRQRRENSASPVRRCAQILLLTFVLKNGMNIPHNEFYGLFVPFFDVAAMGVAAELNRGPAGETGGSGI